MGNKHDDVFQSEHFSGKRSKKKRAYDGRQGLRLAYHEDAHAYVDAAEHQQKMCLRKVSPSSLPTKLPMTAPKRMHRELISGPIMFSPFFT